LLERITGSTAKFQRPAYSAPTVSRSVCGGWQIDTNQRLETVDSVLGFAEYITKWNAEAHPAIRGKAYGVSQSISHKARTQPPNGSTGQSGRFNAKGLPAMTIGPSASNTASRGENIKRKSR